MAQMAMVTYRGNISVVCHLSLMIYCGKPQTPQRDVAMHRNHIADTRNLTEKRLCVQKCTQQCVSFPSYCTTWRAGEKIKSSNPANNTSLSYREACL